MFLRRNFLPFFLLKKGGSCLFAVLAGSEKNDKKVSCMRLPNLGRSLDRNSQTESQLSQMQKHEKLERRETSQRNRNGSALPMSRLRLSLLKVIRPQVYTSLFFSFSKSGLEELS
jgi:hypothetical protein